MCGHEICQMRNLSISHEEAFLSYNADWDYWSWTSYINVEHEFDDGGDHKQIWKFQHSSIEDGKIIPIKYAFNSGFKE